MLLQQNLDESAANCHVFTPIHQCLVMAIYLAFSMIPGHNANVSYSTRNDNSDAHFCDQIHRDGKCVGSH